MDVPPTTWKEEELRIPTAYPIDQDYDLKYSKYNPTPGTGRTGFYAIPPNNYPFYNDQEKYVPCIQADGGQLSEWAPMYNPSKEEAEKDRAAAYAAKVPHGYVAPGDKYKGMPTIDLLVVSEMHDDTEYGEYINEDGQHYGGPLTIQVSPKMRIEELHRVIRDKAGIIPALQLLSYAGKHLSDSQRTLEQYGIAYWHHKFPLWPLKVRKYK